MQKAAIIFLIFILMSCNHVTDKQSVLVNPVESSNSKIEKAYISFRVGVPIWTSEERCNELFSLFDKYKGITDEITFFTSSTHAPLPLDVFSQRTRILKDRMIQAHKHGYKTGINILTTIGHQLMMVYGLVTCRLGMGVFVKIA